MQARYVGKEFRLLTVITLWPARLLISLHVTLPSSLAPELRSLPASRPLSARHPPNLNGTVLQRGMYKYDNGPPAVSRPNL